MIDRFDLIDFYSRYNAIHDVADTFQIHKNLIQDVSSFLPRETLIVGESGIKNREDFREMKKYVRSALIGTYFMQKEDIAKAYKELIL
jgi:indole-3-glycerol phosphate synthase